MSAALTPSNPPRCIMRILPPPPSSDGVPSTRTVMPRSSASGARAEGGTDGRRGDHVVAAGMADLGKGVVLGADRDRERSGPGTRGERGRQVADPALDGEAGIGERLGAPGRRLLLLEAELRVAVDHPRQPDQLAAGALDRRKGLLLGGLGGRHPGQPMTATTSPAPSESPTDTRSCLTVPARSALIGFSIFMASSTQMVWFGLDDIALGHEHLDDRSLHRDRDRPVVPGHGRRGRTRPGAGGRPLGRGAGWRLRPCRAPRA